MLRKTNQKTAVFALAAMFAAAAAPSAHSAGDAYEAMFGMPEEKFTDSRFESRKVEDIAVQTKEGLKLNVTGTGMFEYDGIACHELSSKGEEKIVVNKCDDEKLKETFKTVLKDYFAARSFAHINRHTEHEDHFWSLNGKAQGTVEKNLNAAIKAQGVPVKVGGVSVYFDNPVLKP